MHLGIIGAGQVGATLGRRFATAGHRISYGARDPAKTAAEVLPGHTGEAEVVTLADLAPCRVVLLATPWSAACDSVRALPPLPGRVIIDCTNPIKGRLEGLDPGGNDSGGEVVQRAVPGCRVVKSFHTCGFEVMADPQFANGRACMPVCGDDAQARAVATDLAAAIGFRPVDFGPLRNARYLEPLAMAWIMRAIALNAGRRWAFGIVE